ncbi:hypothetical protein [Sinanaerobacter chloroacetimidivorans]|uniref:Uncharacterized protein n=1 Tax=Sinanaerobacter chloroacetimidivorans TaxID=2818044 RepID=A0A8J7W2U0_9FIRM|nr:hypothetical protein [Sinanaerobacter chloroacetimidivorans]MBR0597860.1 hypothetical protein [Sinanaerobacter chloroacetimidivorans]
MTPIYEQIGPWLIEYAMHIPLAVIGFVLLCKEGVFKKPGGKILFILVVFICLFFPISQAYWHFQFPVAFPLHETILQ